MRRCVCKGAGPGKASGVVGTLLLSAHDRRNAPVHVHLLMHMHVNEAMLPVS